MKTPYIKILVLVMAAAVLLIATVPCRAAGKGDKPVWSEDEPMVKGKRGELTEERIDRIMSRLKETDPEKAAELAQLREKDPAKFKEELREIMRERFGNKPRGDKGPGGEPERGMLRDRLRERGAEFLEWLEANYPEEARKLAELKEGNPELYARQLRLCFRKYWRIAEASKENPELTKILKDDLELKKERDELLRKIMACSNEVEKQKLTAELEEVIGNRFDLIVKRKQIGYEQLRKEIEKLQEQVKQSEAQIEDWKKSKTEKVKEHLTELLSRPEKFEWEE